MPQRSAASATDTRLVTVVVCAGAWWAIFGWDTDRYRGSDGYIHGPWSAWQVAIFAVVLIALGLWVGWRDDALISPVAAAVVTVVDFAITAQNVDVEEPNLWPVGALLIGGAVLIGGVVVAAVAADLVALRSSRRWSVLTAPGRRHSLVAIEDASRERDLLLLDERDDALRLGLRDDLAVRRLRHVPRRPRSFQR